MNVDRSSLARFFRQQTVYVSVSAIVGAIFWAIGQRINPATVIVYSLLFGNLVTPLMDRLHFVYWKRPFPYNWLLLGLVLIVITPPVFVFTSAVVWLVAPPAPQSLWHLITAGWKFPVLVIVMYSVVGYLYRSTRERLEQRNRELQQSVERGSAQLEMQEQELRRAREIQQSLLPKMIPQLPGFEVAAAWRPARTVSGDYYDVFKLGDRRLGICIADVVGKGVSAALLMANVQAAVRALASGAESAAAVCGKVNRLLCENIATGKFVTFLYGVLDCQARTFTYCNAGHLQPIVVSGGVARTIEPGGAVLGVFADWKYEDVTAELQPGDRLLLFTDGITEAADAEQLEFGEIRLAAFARDHSRSSAEELNGSILAEVDTFCDSHFQDDATLLVVAAK